MTYSHTSTFGIRFFAILTVLSLILSALPAPFSFAEAVEIDPETSTPTYDFLLEKKISDNVTPDPYTAAEFSFRVTGGEVDILVGLEHGTNDYASKVVSLPVGDYTVEEVGPAGFVPTDWTIQWSGYGCQNANGPSLTTGMTVTDDVSGNVCRADNQW